MDGYGRWGHDFKSRASTVPPSRLETVPSLIQPKATDHGFESRLPPCLDLRICEPSNCQLRFIHPIGS